MDLPNFPVARYRSYAGKMPTFYRLMVLPMLLQAIMFRHCAPWWGGVAPMLGFAAYGMGMSVWWKSHVADEIDEVRARRRLRRAGSVLVVSALVLTAADIFLFSIADEEHRDLLIFMDIISALTAAYFNMLFQRIATLLMVLGTINATAGLIVMQRPFAGAVTLFLAAAVASTRCLIRSYSGELEGIVHAQMDAQRLGNANIRLASLDMITGLPNRREFFRVLHDVLSDRARADLAVCVALVDLDGFKSVNDTHGHRVGDRVLAVVGSRLQAALPPGVSLFRLGGDEFAFLLFEEPGERKLNGVGQTVIEAVSRPMRIDMLTTSVGCSIGFAWCADVEMPADKLYECADFALYEAKRLGRGRVVIFSPEHAERMQAQGRIEHALRVADLEREFYPLFQPLTDSLTGETVAFESLARWTSPIVGDVSPGVFIPIAEQAGLISTLTAVLLRKTLDAMHDWPSTVAVSFNLSPHDLISQFGVGDIMKIIHDSGIDPHRVGLELTETALLNNFEVARRNMELLRIQGVHVALDDFGAGFSSLSHVNLLPLDKLKIDRCFTVNVETSCNSQKIIRLLTQLCDELKIECIIEGVETQRQVALLRELGCRIMQGYVYARPMQSSQVLPYMAATAANPSEPMLAQA